MKQIIRFGGVYEIVTRWCRSGSVPSRLGNTSVYDSHTCAGISGAVSSCWMACSTSRRHGHSMSEALLHRFPKVVVLSYECLSMVASWRASIGLVVSSWVYMSA